MAWHRERISYPSGKPIGYRPRTRHQFPATTTTASSKKIPPLRFTPQPLPFRCLHVRPLHPLLKRTILGSPRRADGNDVSLAEYWSDEAVKQLMLRFIGAKVLRLPNHQLIDANTMLTDDIFYHLLRMLSDEVQDVADRWCHDILLVPLHDLWATWKGQLPQLRHLQTLCWHLPFHKWWHPTAPDLYPRLGLVLDSATLAPYLLHWLQQPTPILTLGHGRRMCRQTALQAIVGKWWVYPFLDLSDDGVTLVWKMPRIRENTPNFFSLWTYT